MKTETEGKRARRRFTAIIKAGVVRPVPDEDNSIAEVARELDLTASAVGAWVAQAWTDRSKGRTGLTSEERAELAWLRKENRELRMERDILNKPRPFSPRTRHDVRPDRRGEGRVPDHQGL